jgi:oligopeptide transport system substrate-binding protein
MLYEGLMRAQADGSPGLAMAEAISVSPDQKTYTFTLKESAWSDGSPVTANDFEGTWKSLLDPAFPSPNAYQLYCIKGAQAAKEGRSSISEVGVTAPDAKTLVVELENPTPYFLSLVATHFYSPVHFSLRKEATDISQSAKVVTNGPFQMEQWKRRDEFTAIPNPHYWDASSVRLEKIAFIVLDNPTALQLFLQGELDWTGSPLSTLSIDALSSLKKEKILEITPAAGVFLMRVNTEKPPFTNAKMRQAFALALNRSDLVEHVLQGNQIPALGIIPPSFASGSPSMKDHDIARAQELFQEALTEQKISANELPPITLSYAAGERSHKIAQVAQQQWKEGLGIDVTLQSTEGKVYFDQLKKHDYQLGIGTWYADFRDPISFLEIFKLKDNGTNNTQWEHKEYIAFLDQSGQEIDPIKRIKLLKKGEDLLMQEMPVIPLFYGTYNFVKQPDLNGVYFSELGYLDFRYAHKE